MLVWVIDSDGVEKWMELSGGGGGSVGATGPTGPTGPGGGSDTAALIPVQMWTLRGDGIAEIIRSELIKEIGGLLRGSNLMMWASWDGNKLAGYVGVLVLVPNDQSFFRFGGVRHRAVGSCKMICKRLGFRLIGDAEWVELPNGLYGVISNVIMGFERGMDNQAVRLGATTGECYPYGYNYGTDLLAVTIPLI